MSKLDYTFENLGAIGIVKDLSDKELPENAWTDGQNVRFREGRVQRFTGHDQVFGDTTASSGPIFAMEVPKGNDLFWIYADENYIYGTDGTTHENMSSSTAAATLDIGWNGAVLGGGVVVMNNGVNTPQQWTGTSLTDNFTDLANWPSGMVARVLKSHDQFLVAADIDEGGGRDGTLLRWSHPATPGAVPVSWDWQDKTKAAGRTVISDGGDRIIDMLKLRDTTIIYKGAKSFRMSWIGGRAQFQFRKLFDEVGLLSDRCAKEFYGNHFVVSNSDVLLHDGQTVNSIFNRRWQSYLFNAIDSTNIGRTFVAPNYRMNEMWICYPEVGYDLPNMAVVWNWKDNTISVRELPRGCAHAVWGVIDPAIGTTFQDLSGTYEDQKQAFDDQNYSGVKQGLLMCSYTDNAFYRADQTLTFDGVAYDSYVQRSYLPLGNITRSGRMVYAPSRVKTVHEIWPIIEADNGTVVTISVGSRYTDNQSISWERREFVVGVDTHVKFRKTGRIIDIAFSSQQDFQLSRYRAVFNLAKGHR